MVQKIVFIILYLIIILFLFFLLYLMQNRWYGYLALFGLAVGVVFMFSESLTWNHAGERFLVLILVACLGFGITFVSRENLSVSYRAHLISSIIRQVILSPSGTVASGTAKESHWQVPAGFRRTEVQLSHATLEFLSGPDATKNNTLIFQFHGGAYVSAMSDSYRDVAVCLIKKTGIAHVATLDYRTAPEYVYPAALEDALEAYQYLLDQGYKGENILFFGDSAGANLALATALYLRDHAMPLPKALALSSPWIDLADQGESYQQNLYRDVMFGSKPGWDPKTAGVEKTYAGSADVYDPYLSPVYAEYHDFPPVLISVGSYEMLLSDSTTLHAKLQAAGRISELHVYEGLYHNFPEIYGDWFPEGQDAWRQFERFLSEHA